MTKALGREGVQIGIVELSEVVIAQVHADCVAPRAMASSLRAIIAYRLSFVSQPADILSADKGG